MYLAQLRIFFASPLAWILQPYCGLFRSRTGVRRGCLYPHERGLDIDMAVPTRGSSYHVVNNRQLPTNTILTLDSSSVSSDIMAENPQYYMYVLEIDIFLFGE